MFKKKPQIKPLAPLRSSDRRRTADQIISNLGLRGPLQDGASEEDKAAATAEHTNLRNSLLPENAQSARFTTTHGPDLKHVSGTVFVGSHDGEDQRILWWKIEDDMYPSVYTLWHNSGIVPLLHATGSVILKLQGGADLMTPGLVGGPPFPTKATNGAVVAVASTEKPTVPVVVGKCRIDVSALQQVQGAKGQAVQTAHWYEDELWAWSTTSKPGGRPPEHLDGWETRQRDEKDLADQTRELDIQDEGGGVSVAGDRQEPSDGGLQNGHVPDDPTTEESPVQLEGRRLTTKEIDEAFCNAFLYGVYHYKATNKGQKNFGLEFPLTQSFVMSTLVQPFLPIFTPEQGSDLQIKNTSYKKIKKFIKALDKQQLIKSKDRDGNEVVILDIDFDDHAILDFNPYKLPKKETLAGTSLGRGGKATSEIDTDDPSVGQSLKIIQLYKPKERLAPIFEASKSDSHALYSAADIRTITTTYIETNQLISDTNKRLVKLDPVLANAVFDGSQPLDSQVHAKGSVARDALVDRVGAACAQSYAILRNDATLASVKPRAGAPPKVKITLETRGGNKTATKVSGVESFYIAPAPLADELRKACAGSASVDALHGASPKEERKEIMVQGPQRDAVLKALDRRGVSARWVEFTDKTKGKKR